MTLPVMTLPVMTQPRRPEGPQRTCVGCRRRTAQADLIRLVVGPDGIAVGRTRPGRGAWLCDDAACVEAALAKGALARALRVDRSSIDAAAVRRAVSDSVPADRAPGATQR